MTKISGEKNLVKLLQSMKPTLLEEEYVFCCVAIDQVKNLDLAPICQFRESEGVTLIVTRQEAETANLPYQFISKLITLSVHSSLEAIGFLAAITQKLAQHEISVNAVSAYYHDHLFVPVEKADQAMQLLAEMSQ